MNIHVLVLDTETLHTVEVALVLSETKLQIWLDFSTHSAGFRDG